MSQSCYCNKLAVINAVLLHAYQFEMIPQFLACFFDGVVALFASPSPGFLYIEHQLLFCAFRGLHHDSQWLSPLLCFSQ